MKCVVKRRNGTTRHGAERAKMVCVFANEITTKLTSHHNNTFPYPCDACLDLLCFASSRFRLLLLVVADTHKTAKLETVGVKTKKRVKANIRKLYSARAVCCCCFLEE